MKTLEDQIKEQARQLGFELVGISAAEDAATFPAYQEWLRDGCAGDMSYLHRQGEARRHPQSVLQSVRTVVMLGMNYKPPAPADETPTPLSGKVARYARGADYHEVLRPKLNALLLWIQGQVPNCRGRGIVDTGPLLERDFARRAGLGWFGKNTMLLNKQLGSYFFLAALVLDLPLRPDPPHVAHHCGTCTACLDACPTAAFDGPWRLDARKCISYLTIELRGPIPVDYREHLADWVFGCDICQEVCPWNNKAPAGAEPAFHGEFPLGRLQLVDLLEMSEADFRKQFRHTALWRTKWRGMRRNAAIALGNLRDAQGAPALERAAQDPDTVVAEAAQWALNRLRGRCNA